MKAQRVVSFTLIVMLLCLSPLSFSQNENIFKKFIASTPANNLAGVFLGIPPDIDYEFIKWNLVFFKKSDSHNSGKFNLLCTYGISKPNTTGFMEGRKKVEINGTWSAANNDGRKKCILKSDEGKELSFIVLDDNLMHMLDNKNNLVAGNAAWSFTLNRVKD